MLVLCAQYRLLAKPRFLSRLVLLCFIGGNILAKEGGCAVDSEPTRLAALFLSALHPDLTRRDGVLQFSGETPVRRAHL